VGRKRFRNKKKKNLGFRRGGAAATADLPPSKPSSKLENTAAFMRLAGKLLEEQRERESFEGEL